MGWKIATPLALAAMAMTATTAFAQGSELDNWEFAGYFDWYYSKNMNKPSPGTWNVGRKYDLINKTPYFTDFMLHMQRRRTNNIPFGIHIDLAAGRNADIDNELEPAGSDAYKHLRQAYISLGPEEGRWSLDLGKFSTWFGYESRLAMDNANYSRSLQYTFLQPIYHFGGRAMLQLNDNWDAGVYVVNGWNEVEDSGDELGFGAHLGYSSERWGGRLNVYTGKESDVTVADGFSPVGGFGWFGPADVTALELILDFAVSDRVNIGFDATMLDIDSDSGPDSEITGIGGYLTYDSGRNWDLGVRLEVMDDDQGARTGNDGNWTAATVTWNWHVSENSMLRFEFRNDNADNSIFPNSTGTKDSQSTWSISFQMRMP